MASIFLRQHITGYGNGNVSAIATSRNFGSRSIIVFATTDGYLHGFYYNSPNGKDISNYQNYNDERVISSLGWFDNANGRWIFHASGISIAYCPIGMLHGNQTSGYHPSKPVSPETKWVMYGTDTSLQRTALKVIKEAYTYLSSPTAFYGPDLGATVTGCDIRKTSTNNGYIFSSAGNNGLFVHTWLFSGSPLNITFSNQASDYQGGTYGEIIDDGSYVFVCCGTSGIRAYTYDGTSLTHIDTYSDGTNFTHIKGDSSRYLMATAGGSGVKLFSFDGSTFTLEDSRYDGGSAEDIDYNSAKYFFLANGTDSIRIYTVSEGSVVTDPPSTISIHAGKTGSISAGVTGAVSYYQWQEDGIEIPGATGLNYTIGPVSESDDGKEFSLKVYDGLSYIESGSSTLNVLTTPTIIDQPQDQTTYNDSTATFEAEITGYEPTYQWYQITPTGTSGITGAISGATGTSYTTPTVWSDSSGTGYFIKTSETGANDVYSDIATLTVNSALSIVEQPTNQTLISSNTATFDVGATGYNLTYQWYKIDPAAGSTGAVTGAISGATGSSYTTPALEKSTDDRDGYFVGVTETGAAGTVYSDIALALVYDIINENPRDETIYNGGYPVFDVGTTGAWDKTYQWYKRETDGTTGAIAGATGAIYTGAQSSVFDDGEYYWVSVGASGTTEYSDRARLNVSSVLGVVTGPVDLTVAEGFTGSVGVGATGFHVTYQWYEINGLGNTGAVSSATGADYTVGPVATTDDGYGYMVRIREAGSDSTVYSPIATLTVSEDLKVLAQNEYYVTEDGGEARFWVVVTGGTPPYTYEWYRSDDSGVTFTGPIQGATGATYIIPTVGLTGIGDDNGDLYYCTVTDSAP